MLSLSTLIGIISTRFLDLLLGVTLLVEENDKRKDN